MSSTRSTRSALVLIPDDLQRPMGGMGVQLSGILRGAVEAGIPWKFVVVGAGGPAASGPGYEYFPTHLRPVGLGGGPYLSMLAQVDYLDAGLWAGLKFNVDLVHCMDFSTAYAGIRLAQRLGVPLVATFQLSQVMLALEAGVPLGSADKEFLDFVLALERAMVVEADAVLCVSEAYRTFWSLVVPTARSKMFVLPNGVDAARGGFPRPAVFGSGFNLVYLGRACVQKGSHSLLQAVGSAAWPVDVRLFWVGDDRGGSPMIWREVQAMASAGRLTLLGYLTGDEKWAVLEHADAVIMPSTHEPFGIVALEAMASGTVLVTTGATGLGEFCDESNCVLMASSVEGILDGVERVHGLDSVKRQELVTAGRFTAARFQWSSIAQGLAGIYEKVVDRK